jgi:hypothetical protein
MNSQHIQNKFVIVLVTHLSESMKDFHRSVIFGEKFFCSLMDCRTTYVECGFKWFVPKRIIRKTPRMVYKNVRFWVLTRHVYVVIIWGIVCLQIKLVLPYAALLFHEEVTHVISAFYI